MKKLFKKIIHSMKGFFDWVITKEAERVFEFDAQFLGGKSNKGGGSGKIKTNLRHVRKVYYNY